MLSQQSKSSTQLLSKICLRRQASVKTRHSTDSLSIAQNSFLHPLALGKKHNKNNDVIAIKGSLTYHPTFCKVWVIPEMSPENKQGHAAKSHMSNIIRKIQKMVRDTYPAVYALHQQSAQRQYHSASLCGFYISS